MSHPGYSLGRGLTPLLRCSCCYLHPQQTRLFYWKRIGIHISLCHVVHICRSKQKFYLIVNFISYSLPSVDARWPYRSDLNSVSVLGLLGGDLTTFFLQILPLFIVVVVVSLFLILLLMCLFFQTFSCIKKFLLVVEDVVLPAI